MDGVIVRICRKCSFASPDGVLNEGQTTTIRYFLCSHCRWLEAKNVD